MSIRKIILILILNVIFLLLYGFYREYQIFYVSYFNQIEYIHIGFIDTKEVPTKIEIFFQDSRICVF